MHQITNKNILFDTNAYRSLSGGKEENVRELFINLAKRERENNIVSLSQPIVLMELLSHLADSSDDNYNICKKALIGAYIHCKEIDKYPPRMLLDFDVHLCELLFKEHKEKLEAIEQSYGRIAYQVYRDSSEKNLEILRSKFKIISNKVKELEKVFLDKFINAFNINDKEEFDEAVKSGKFLRILASAQVEKTLNYMDINKSNISKNDFEIYIDKVIEKFKTPLILFQTFIQKAFINYDSMKIEEKANIFFDFQILFIVGDHIIKNNKKPIILVTDDKDMIRASNELNYSDKIIKVNDYLKIIGLKSLD